MTGAPSWQLPGCAAALALVVVGGSLVTARSVQTDLRTRGCTALAEAGLAGATVTWSGRDAAVASDDDLGRLTSTVAVLSRLRGARSVRVDPAAVAVVGTCPVSGQAAGAGGGTATGTATATDAATRTVSVKFATNSAALDRTARAQLDALAGWLRDHPEARLSVRGHTDNTGFDVRNVPLSYQRANTVADYLRSRPGAVLITEVRGHSSEDPLVPNVTPENRALNRRADVVVEGVS